MGAETSHEKPEDQREMEESVSLLRTDTKRDDQIKKRDRHEPKRDDQIKSAGDRSYTLPRFRDLGLARRRLREALLGSNRGEFDAALDNLTLMLDEVRNLGEVSRSAALEYVDEESTGFSYTSLQIAVKNGREYEVGKLLDAGAETRGALFCACEAGIPEILKLLLDKVQSDENIDTLLHCVVRGFANGQSTRSNDVLKLEQQVDRAGCLKLLLESDPPLDVNAQDKGGWTPLHYAARQKNQSMISQLLIKGALLGLKNKAGVMPVQWIRPETIGSVLDCYVHSSLSPEPESQREFEDKSFDIEYNILLPPKDTAQSGTNKTNLMTTEMALLHFVSQSPRHSRLLLHPVLSTFTTIRWHRFQPLYLLAVVQYFSFVAILTAYVYLKFDVNMSNSAGSATSNSTGLDPSPRVSTDWLFAMEVTLWVVLVFLVLREMLEVAVSSWRDYIDDHENFLQVLLIILLPVMLISTVSELTRLHIAVLSIILACLEFFLLLGRHPQLSTYIMMFRTVTENFIKFILLYSLLIVSFSIAFNLLFRNDEHFSTFIRALMKTVIMSTGEMEYTSLEFMHSSDLGQIAFFGFFFLIVLVLMNLLNGMAVSDTVEIQADSELNSLIARVNLINYIEMVVFQFREKVNSCKKSEPAATSLNNIHLPPACLDFKCSCFRKCLPWLCPTGCAGTIECSKMKKSKRGDRFYLTSEFLRHRIRIDKKEVELVRAIVARKDHGPDDQMTTIEQKLDALMKRVEKIDAPSQHGPDDQMTTIEQKLDALMKGVEKIDAPSQPI